MSNVNLDLNYEGFKNDWFMQTGNDSQAWREYYFRFENDYGAVVSKDPGDYGYCYDLWTLRPCRYTGAHEDPYKDEIVFETTRKSFGDNSVILELLQALKENPTCLN